MVVSKDKIKHPRCPGQQISCSHSSQTPDRRRPSQTSQFHVHTHRKNRRRRGPSGMYLQSRNASDSSDDVVKIADRLGRLGWGVYTGRKNPRRRKILKIPDSYDS